MRDFVTTLATLAVMATAGEASGQQTTRPEPRAPETMRSMTPALAAYTDEVLFGQVWRRPGLVPRDRSVVTVSALVAGGRTAQLTGHLNLALDNGLQPTELSALITHLAFYSGWPNSVSAVNVADEVFRQRGIDPATLRPASAALLPMPSSDAARAELVDKQVGGIAPGLAQFTNEVLFNDLWRRPDLAPRDRSLVTIAALIATGDAAQLPFHLNLGLDNSLTQDQIAEVVTHLAFYAGWPKAMSAVPVVKTVFEARAAAAEQPAATGGQQRAAVEVQRSGSKPSSQGSPDYFTGGSVQVSQPFQRSDPARVGGALVTFEPGARTAWHTHPLGQTLIVTSGCGWVQGEGGPVEGMGLGDVVWIPPGTRHWHGATASVPMAHIAIAEALDGKAVEWLEQVSDQQYRGGAPAGSC